MTKTENNPRHPDIEIYLKGITASDVEQWLEQRFEHLEQVRKKQQVHHYLARYQGHEFKVLVIEKAAKLYTSVLFESSQTPWAQDIDCAREAFQQFGVQVRCIATGWNEGDDPDEWIAISERGEEQINWRL